VHALEDSVRSGLKRQVKVSRDLRAGGEYIDRALIEMARMGRDVPDSLHRLHGGDRFEQRGEIRSGDTLIEATSDGLPEELHLLETARGEVAHLAKDVVQRSAELATSGVLMI